MKVQILIGVWAGSFGTLEDKIPNSNWFNVRAASDLRLALAENEFEII